MSNRATNPRAHLSITAFYLAFFRLSIFNVRKGSVAAYPGKVGKPTGTRPNCIRRSATRAARTMACSSGSIPPLSTCFLAPHGIIRRTSVSILFVPPHSGRFIEILLLPAPLARALVHNLRPGRHIAHSPLPSRAVSPSDQDVHPMTPLVKRCIQIGDGRVNAQCLAKRRLQACGLVRKTLCKFCKGPRTFSTGDHASSPPADLSHFRPA